MILKNEDRERLKKLGISNLLDLVLLSPTRYKDLYIHDSPRLDTENVLDITVQSTNYNPKYMRLTLFSHNLNQEINGIIFHPNKYHTDTFKIGNRLNVVGKLEMNYEKLQITQPQHIEKINTIVPRYKTKLQNKTIVRLMSEQVTKEAFKAYDFDEKLVEILLQIHNPTIESVTEFEKNEGYSDAQLYCLKYVDIYNHIQKLSSKKVEFSSKKKLSGDLDSFIKSLPFILTNDQLKVIDEIKKDFLKDIAAKRVIMGDVGSGKTMVILACVVLAYPSKSILMAPTTVLASQIYDEAKKFLPKNFKIILVTNKSDKKESLDSYDFLIGTHALLYRDVPDADLIMIDEQHRFGTKQRELISALVSLGERKAHFLQFSATPIPRTLSMMQSSIIDISEIKELPFPKNIETKIIGYDEFEELTTHIQNEIQQGRQCIVVYPLVQESEAIDYQSIYESRSWWEKRFEKVYVTYGKDKEKQEVLEAFRKDGNILIATTLIEVGISLPNLSTIVLVAPERLGLASLHQLRGRVSRTGLKGYCFLFTKQKANQRLENFASTIDGFEIAELDLQYRQAGDLLKGEEQSGRSFKWFSPKNDIKILQRVKKDLRV